MITSKKIKFTTIFFLMALSFYSIGQNISRIGVNEKYGYILAHTNTIHQLVQQHFSTYELNVNFSIDSSSITNHLYNNPQWGLGIIHSNWGYEDVFGKIYALGPHFIFPLHRSKSWLFQYKLSVGLGYVSKPFHTDNNFHNLAIGSKINAYVNFDFYFTHKLSNHFALDYGLGLYHLSNAGYQKPNLGINTTYIKLGINYLLDEQFFDISSPNFEKQSYRLEYRGIGNVGITENYPVLGRKYVALNSNHSVHWNTWKKTKLGFGLDYFYDPSKIELIHKEEQVEVDHNMQISQLGLTFLYQLQIDQVAASVQMGAYLLSKYKGNGRLYHRIGLHYYTKKNLVFNLSMKTHWANADNFELGMGYYFRK